MYLEIEEIEDFFGVDEVEDELMNELKYEILKNSNVVDIDETSSGIEILMDEGRECSITDYDSYLIEKGRYC